MLELRVDKLVNYVGNNEHEVLTLIHNDPLLSKREVDGLFIANASKELHGPTELHQQIAKGIVYTFDEELEEFVVVALPLLKIWNAHEMEQDQSVIINQLINEGSSVSFLEKLDGTMISRFVWKDKVYFATRGVILGDELAEDYVQKAVDIAEEKYPMLMDPKSWPIHTLVMELIHPDCRVITNYGDRQDLVLTAAVGPFFTHDAYWHVSLIAKTIGMPVAPRYEAKGDNYKEQMQDLLSQIAGTDAEGFMMTIENPAKTQVQYRVKLKGADYIRLLRLMNYCTYKHVVEMILADNSLMLPDNFKSMLAQNSGDDLPQYVVDEYMSLVRQYSLFYSGVAFFVACVGQVFDRIVEGKTIPLSREDKKAFAVEVKDLSYKSLMFKMADGKSAAQIIDEICRNARHDQNYLVDNYGEKNG